MAEPDDNREYLEWDGDDDILKDVSELIDSILKDNGLGYSRGKAMATKEFKIGCGFKMFVWKCKKCEDKICRYVETQVLIGKEGKPEPNKPIKCPLGVYAPEWQWDTETNEEMERD